LSAETDNHLPEGNSWHRCAKSKTGVSAVAASTRHYGAVVSSQKLDAAHASYAYATRQMMQQSSIQL
jgi:hypothetical protein